MYQVVQFSDSNWFQNMCMYSELVSISLGYQQERTTGLSIGAYHWALFKYLRRSSRLKASFSTSSRAFWRGQPWSSSMKQMPTDSLVTAYSKQEYFLLSSMTQPQRTPLRMSRAAWLSMRCLRQMARGVLPWESSTSQLMLVSSRQRMEKKNFFSQAQCRGVLWQQSTMLRSISLQLSSVCMISTLSLGGSSGAPCSSPLIFMKQQKMGVRPYLSRLLIFTPYSSSFMQISGEESKFVALETKWCRALRSLRSRMSAEAPCSPRMLSISCTLNFCLFLMISISGTWFSKLQLFMVLPYARSRFMNFSCPFRAAYSRGVDRLMSRMLEVSPFSSRYSRHLWLSQSGPRLMRMRGTGLMSTSSVLKSEPSRFHMQKRCRGVLPSLFWELKNLSIHFMKFLSSTSDGNLIRKCWMPHFLQFSFSFSTRGSHTMLRGSAPFSTRNPTSFSRLVSCSTYSPNAFWMQASCTFSLSLSASGCSFRKPTQFRLKLECTVWVKFFIRKTMNSKPKQSAFLNSRRRTLGSTWESLSSTKKTSALPRQAMLVRQQTKWLFLVGGWMSKGISFMSSWIPIEFSFSMQQLTGLCCFSVMISESAPYASSCLIRMPCISWYSLGRMQELSLVRCSQQSFSLMEQRRCRQVSPMLVYWQLSWQMLELSKYSIILKNSGVPRGFFSSRKMRWWWWGKFITLLPFISSSCAQWKCPFSTATSQGQKFFLLGICSMILRRNITSSMLPQAAAQCSIVLLLQSRLKLPCASFSSWKKMSLWWLRRATTRGLRRKLSKLLRIPLPMMSCTRLLLPPPAAKCRIEKRSLVSSCGFTRWSSSSSDTHSSCWWITAQCRALRPSSLLWFMYSLSLSFSNMNFITLYRPCWAATIRGVTFFLSIWVSCSELCLCRISMALGDSSVAAQWTGFLLRESPTLNSEMCFRMQVSSSVLELMVAQWMGLQKFYVQFCLSMAALRNWS